VTYIGTEIRYITLPISNTRFFFIIECRLYTYIVYTYINIFVKFRNVFLKRLRILVLIMMPKTNPKYI